MEWATQRGGFIMAEAPQNSVITLFRRVQFCLITSGEISTISPITHVAFGSGGVDSNGDPISPLETQTTLNNQVAIYPINSVNFPIEPRTTARYEVTIPAPDLSGVPISELALVDEEGNLCAIKTFFAVRKSEGIAFTMEILDEF